MGHSVAIGLYEEIEAVAAYIDHILQVPAVKGRVETDITVDRQACGTIVRQRMLGCELVQQQLLKISVDVVFGRGDGRFRGLEFEGIDIGLAIGVAKGRTGRVVILGVLSRGFFGEPFILIIGQHAYQFAELLL